MSQVIVVTRDKALAALVGQSGLSVRPVAPSEFGTLMNQPEVSPVVIVDLRGEGRLPTVLLEFRKRHPTTGFGIVLSSLDPQLMLEAIRAGCNECLAEPLSASSLDEALRRLLVATAPEPTGERLAFVGAKGGVGTTTIAVNVAAALQREAARKVLFIDMHPGLGDATLLFGAEPRFSVLDALENVHRADESFFNSVVEKTKSGVQLLAAAPRPLSVELGKDRVSALLNVAAKTYTTTVLDVPANDQVVLDSLDSTAKIIVVTNQDLASVRNAARMVESLRARYGVVHVDVAVNRLSSDAVIGLDDVERAIGGPVAYAIPSDYATAVEALHAGRPFVSEKGKLAAAVRKVAKELAGGSSDAPPDVPGRVLGLLAWRRA